MPFIVPLNVAEADYPEFIFLAALTPSEQKAAFHVRDAAGQDLCLKIIAPHFSIDRLEREIQALQQLDHPNVVRLKEYTFSSKGGKQRHYMVEEFIAGSDLAASLIDGQPWQRSRVSDFFAALCDGLSALRSANIVHRDLKPTNIRVRTNGSPVIIDFGLARLLDLPDLTKTANGAAIGTPAYFAPEQADPASTKHNIDHRTDLFSVGVMLYQALVGSHPFLKPGMSCQELRSAICTAADWRSQPGFVSLPNPWKLITAKLLEKERARRPLEAEQVGSILRKLGGV